MQVSALNSLQNNYSVKTLKKSENNQTQLQNQTHIISFQGAQGMRSAVLAKSLSFKGQPIPQQLKIIPTEENGEQTGVSNLLALPQGKYEIPNSSLEVVANGKRNFKEVKVIHGDKEILAVKSEKAISPDLEVKFTEGKDGKVATLTGDGFKAVAIEGSEIIRDGFEFKMPSYKKQVEKQVRFGASYHPIMAFKPEVTQQALEKSLPYINELSEKFPIDEELDKNYTVVQTIGGFGTRLCSLGNKTSANTPAGIPLLAYSLLPVIQAGIRIPFSVLPENTTIEEDISVGTAGGVIEGIETGKVPTDKNILIVPGDGIHDINIKPALKAFHKNKEAGMMLIGNAVPQDQISKFGIIGTDTKGLVTKFIEKPKSPDFAKEGIITDANGNYDKENPKYNASIALYALKPPVTKAFLALGDIVRADNKEYDFGKHALQSLQVLCNEDILDNTGKIDKNKFNEVLNTLDEKHPLKKLVQKAGVDKLVKSIKKAGLSVQDTKQALHETDKAINVVREKDKNNWLIQAVNEMGINPVIKQLNPVVQMLKNKDGERMKMIAYAGDADWADVGTIPQFIDTSRQIAAGESFINLPKEIRQGFKDNVLETGISYIPSSETDKRSPKEAFKSFLGENGTAKGNIVVMENE
ncbi:MAG: hypothetical protein A2Y25_06550 [Candidatus Melainabacteria bacterium GWF2_37_15]|nr:MAG: hypothetical protein A2Y25_06550 [Candidatus Melainabacteria bacterium GWF2_37_15]